MSPYIALSHCTITRRSDDPQESKTLVAVFDFLTDLAFKNHKVQNELFEYVDDMLRCSASDQKRLSQADEADKKEEEGGKRYGGESDEEVEFGESTRLRFPVFFFSSAIERIVRLLAQQRT